MTAWDELTAKFTAAGLPLPPIPGTLRENLRTEGDWCWSTRPIDAMAMYAWDATVDGKSGLQFLADVWQDQVADYAAVSHAGYGINSYGLNYHLVHERVAIIMQVGWGGFLTDNAAVARQLAGYWAEVAELLDTPPGPAAPPGKRLVVFFSGFRWAPGLCGWLSRPGGPGERLQEVPFDESPFAVAQRLWTSP